MAMMSYFCPPLPIAGAEHHSTITITIIAKSRQMSSNTESSADEVEKGGFPDAGIIAELEKQLEPEKEIIEIDVKEENPAKKRKAAAPKKSSTKQKPRKQKKAKKVVAEDDDDSEGIVVMPKPLMAKKIKIEPVEEEEEKAPAKKGKIDPNQWLKAPGLSAFNFGQCSECQKLQKELEEVVVQRKEGLSARIVQCLNCFNGNKKLRAFKWEQFSSAKMTPVGEYDFISEIDDYKVTAAQYMCTTMQCNYCNAKQGKMSEAQLIEKMDKKHVMIHLAQCACCRFANKAYQKLFWDNFSNYKKPGKTEEKKKGGDKFEFGKKRKAQKKEESSSSSSSEDEESSSSSSSSSSDEPVVKKKKGKKN